MRIRLNRENLLDEDGDIRYKEPMSDQTAFMRMQTQLEKSDMVDKEFLDRHKARVLAMDKFAPLSYIQDKRMLQIDRMRRLIMSLQMEAGLLEDAEETALDNIADFQLSRGWRGFYQKAMITQRHIIKETSKGERKLGRLAEIMRGGGQPQEDEGVDGLE